MIAFSESDRTSNALVSRRAVASTNDTGRPGERRRHHRCSRLADTAMRQTTSRPAV